MPQIPKVIHYVWLGDEKPQMIKECLISWKSVMPDYEIREWGMADAESIQSEFLHSAIKTKKWAFAADFLRVWILYHYGGVYMDTDIYVYQRFDKFLEHRAFSGIEFWAPEFYKSLRCKKIRGIGVDSAILGAEKGHPWIKDILSLKKEDVLGDTITIDESKTKDRKDGKNRPPRVVGITPQLKRDLENYLKKN